MAKSKFEDVVNALLQRVDSMEKKFDELSRRVDNIPQHSEQQEPEQPKRRTLVFR
jgi:hypothetical protein